MLSDNKIIRGQLSQNNKMLCRCVVVECQALNHNHRHVKTRVRFQPAVKNLQKKLFVRNLPIIVKLTDTTQSCSATKKDMRKNITYIGVPICVIRCSNKNGSVAFQSDVAGNLVSNFKIIIPGNATQKLENWPI